MTVWVKWVLKRRRIFTVWPQIESSTLKGNEMYNFDNPYLFIITINLGKKFLFKKSCIFALWRHSTRIPCFGVVKFTIRSFSILLYTLFVWPEPRIKEADNQWNSWILHLTLKLFPHGTVERGGGGKKFAIVSFSYMWHK